MDVLIGAIVSVLTGAALWAVLPRGVVLTRTVRVQSLSGEPVYDTWEIRNDSPLPVSITGVRVSGPDTYNSKAERVEEVKLPIFEGHGKYGVSLGFADETLEINRVHGRRWRGLEVPPGDTLWAHVLNNRTLTIKYRRSGPFGVLERRVLHIHGTS